jgi:hypothetical protein
MARKRFWFAVAPMIYAVKKKGHERTGVSRRRYVQRICSETTPSTTYFVNGSGPQSCRISRCALMIACLLVLCGSSVYVQKNLSSGSCAWSSSFVPCPPFSCFVVVNDRVLVVARVSVAVDMALFGSPEAFGRSTYHVEVVGENRARKEQSIISS